MFTARSLRFADVDRTDRLRRAESRRQPYARKHRRRRDRRREPARRGRRRRAVILGSVFVTMLSNGMDLLEVGGYIQQITLGGVIIAAVFLDRLRATRV